jgi:plasmid maintenance system antidote protein VapI
MDVTSPPSLSSWTTALRGARHVLRRCRMNDMNENRPKRIYRQFTPEERARWEKARDDSLALRPQLSQKARQLREAAQEPTFSGALRAAIHKHQKPLPIIAAEVGISVTHLDEFLTGERTLRSDVVDRLNQVLGFQFPPQALSVPPKMELPEVSAAVHPIIEPTTLQRTPAEPG